MNTTVNSRSSTEGQRLAGQKAADVLQLAHAGDGVADPARLEVGQRQRQHVAKQASAEFDIDPARGVAENIVAQRVKDVSKTTTTTRPIDDDVERCQAPVYQHLVHHHLKKERGDESEELKEEAETTSISNSSLRYLTRPG